jgi:hypothetical protein
VALREKDLGLWREFTWNDYQVRVRDFTPTVSGFGWSERSYRRRYRMSAFGGKADIIMTDRNVRF